MNKHHLKFFLVVILFTVCQNILAQNSDNIKVGAEQPELYLSKLKSKRIALIVNPSSMVGQTHLVDYLLSKKINIKRIFAPEHGFRGNVNRGESFASDTDKVTRLPIVALYGKNVRPTKEQLQDIDIVIYDLQDVGVRFFTYISTMGEVMNACASNQKKLIILDRPNPNSDYIDGPVLQPAFKSFVGKYPIPVVYGLTAGELAKMINGEKWLDNGLLCDLEIIAVKNYTHKTFYTLPVKPSPNLPNDLSIRLYPSLCFFEATKISVGRGTTFPFQVIGYPDKSFGTFEFTPQSIPSMEKKPLHENKICYGIDLRNAKTIPSFTLKYIIDFYKMWTDKNAFVSDIKWFNLLAGNDNLLKQIRDNKTETEIKASWKKELDDYKLMRKKYLIYKD